MDLGTGQTLSRNEALCFRPPSCPFLTFNAKELFMCEWDLLFTNYDPISHLVP